MHMSFYYNRIASKHCDVIDCRVLNARLSRKWEEEQLQKKKNRFGCSANKELQNVKRWWLCRNQTCCSKSFNGTTYVRLEHTTLALGGPRATIAPAGLHTKLILFFFDDQISDYKIYIQHFDARCALQSCFPLLASKRVYS